MSHNISNRLTVKKFQHGRLLVTSGVNEQIADSAEFSEFINISLQRHIRGDWGEVCQDDWTANELALLEGERLFSVYKKDGVSTIWIITERDRSATTVLFPDEY